ncbi:glycosyltransferase family 2 protein [Halieaceae bacterium IMCC14734]|uniref:Glycosyltransferase family 2 protein n=1 Tax=Candidatus Litorirhabdus singularis TaxID=2518993 RepID=A0ABT3TG88_9GAMM|nr:glycosyltransferase family 2 protein [Candidatus Litorirhabdus singularis]MCX2981323.1 glycosyltransferase family 2 protein [Candidatus Litorirhabdus singularis]
MVAKIIDYLRKNFQYLRSKNQIRKLSDYVISNDKNEIRLFAIAKNEMLRFPFFLEYYRKLGVNTFFILDNNSDDGLTEYLLKQKDVHLFHTKESYTYQLNWRLFLLNSFGQGHWCVTVDADELMVFDHSEKRGLLSLIEELQDANANCLRALWIDMYSDKAIREADYNQGESFFEACHYFDRESATKSVNERVFGWRTECDKTPLVRYQKGLYIDKGFHRVSGEARYAEARCVVFHFNYFSDFIDKCKRESGRAVYFDGGAKYKRFMRVLEQEPLISLHNSKSVKYESSEQLIELSYIIPIK